MATDAADAHSHHGWPRQQRISDYRELAPDAAVVVCCFVGLTVQCVAPHRARIPGNRGNNGAMANQIAPVAGVGAVAEHRPVVVVGS